MQTVNDKYIAMAESLAQQVAIKRRPRLNNTPKRALQESAARIEADHLERARDACLALAKQDAPPFLAKSYLLKMMKTRIEHPSYYVIHDTGEFTDKSPEAVNLRALVDSFKNPADVAERSRQKRIAELIEKVKFSPIPGFFPTPPDVVERMIDAAGLQYSIGCKVLEPSAGIGSIVDKIAKRHSVKCIESNYALVEILKAKGHEAYHEDFLKVCLTVEKFDRILMNPPFENGQDIDHIRHAYGMLAEGGRLVAIMSTGPFFRGDSKSRQFRVWLESVKHERQEIPPKSFQTMEAFRKTGVNCAMLVIDKC